MITAKRRHSGAASSCGRHGVCVERAREMKERKEAESSIELLPGIGGAGSLRFGHHDNVLFRLDSSSNVGVSLSIGCDETNWRHVKRICPKPVPQYAIFHVVHVYPVEAANSRLTVVLPRGIGPLCSYTTQSRMIPCHADFEAKIPAYW